jgi:4-hydroxybenzoate polyprenyltransferase
MGHLTVASTAAVGLLAAGSICLVAHVFVLNDWSGMSDDLRDPNRTSRVFTNRGVSRVRIGHLWMGLLVINFLLLGALSWRTLIIAVMIAGLSALYSAPAAYIKGVPVLNSFLHFAGGLLHFLLGYSVFRAPDECGVEIGCFLGSGIHRRASDPRDARWRE